MTTGTSKPKDKTEPKKENVNFISSEIDAAFIHSKSDKNEKFLREQLEKLNELPSGNGLLKKIAEFHSKAPIDAPTNAISDPTIIPPESPKKISFNFVTEETPRADYNNETSEINMFLPKPKKSSKQREAPLLDIPAITSRKLINTLYGPLDVVAVTKEKAPFFLGLGHELIHALHAYDGSNENSKRKNRNETSSSRIDGIQGNDEEFFTVLNSVGPSEVKLNREYQQTLSENDRIGPRYIYHVPSEYTVLVEPTKTVLRNALKSAYVPTEEEFKDAPAYDAENIISNLSDLLTEIYTYSNDKKFSPDDGNIKLATNEQIDFMHTKFKLFPFLDKKPNLEQQDKIKLFKYAEKKFDKWSSNYNIEKPDMEKESPPFKDIIKELSDVDSSGKFLTLKERTHIKNQKRIQYYDKALDFIKQFQGMKILREQQRQKDFTQGWNEYYQSHHDKVPGDSEEYGKTEKAVVNYYMIPDLLIDAVKNKKLKIKKRNDPETFYESTEVKKMREDFKEYLYSQLDKTIVK